MQIYTDPRRSVPKFPLRSPADMRAEYGKLVPVAESESLYPRGGIHPVRFPQQELVRLSALNDLGEEIWTVGEDGVGPHV